MSYCKLVINVYVMNLQWLLPLMTRGGKMLNMFKKVFEFFFQKVEHISTFLSHKIITHLFFFCDRNTRKITSHIAECYL